ncbi:CBS domain-containing protein [Kitasatospora sp. NBC_01287]|uniref:CBS domain-containing protein n=1 Tax=Kitasatospora sp. NBC_01287 TaxID=2903573 RepID=UPI002250A910|nr:CBS domain-containing protein [Kitasatospora sp. NBC_01287]MCX4744739.1 CBS domain-containing protein [Kitasatospora sp. NBC_01287]
MTRQWNTVADVMTHPVIAAGRDTTYREILKMLQEWKVSAVPVLAGDGRVVGVVSEADLLLAGERDPWHAPTMTARDLLTSPAVCVHPESPIAQAARAMARQHLKRLPVVDSEGVLVGIVSRSDLLKIHLRSDEELADQVRIELLAVLHSQQASDVDVRVEEGRITLTGSVADTEELPVLERLVRAVPGVVDVEVRPATKS